MFQIRTSVNHLLGASKDFSWPRHICITVALLVCVNILVIFVPTIRDIFGFIGRWDTGCDVTACVVLVSLIYYFDF